MFKYLLVLLLMAGTATAQQTNDCLIKGNISSSGEKVYHMPSSPWYERTKIEENAGERWFCSPEEAEAAGWRRAGR